MTDAMQALAAVQALPPITRGVYELSDAECKKFRRRLYALNKNNAAGWKWRTLRDGTLVLAWRLY